MLVLTGTNGVPPKTPNRECSPDVPTNGRHGGGFIGDRRRSEGRLDARPAWGIGRFGRVRYNPRAHQANNLPHPLWEVLGGLGG